MSTKKFRVLADEVVFIPSSRRSNIRKTLRAVRKQQLRRAEARMRRAHTLRKRLGIKDGIT